GRSTGRFAGSALHAWSALKQVVFDVHQVGLDGDAARRRVGQMIAEHFTRRWQAAGLIDGALAERILAWEARHRRPILLWGVAGVGAIAVSLGIMALVG